MTAYSSLLTEYLGEGLAAARPVTLNIPPTSMGLYFATDTGAMSIWNGATWAALSGAGTVTKVDTTGAGISGGPITGSGTLSVEWNGGTVSTIGTGITLTSGTLSASGGGSGSVTSIVAGAGLDGGTITTAGTISLGTISASELLGNAGTVGGVPTGIVVGTGLSLSATGTLTNTSLNTNIWNAGTVTLVGTGLTLAAGTLTNTSPDTNIWNAGTVSAIGPNLTLAAGTLNAITQAQQWSAGTVTTIGSNITLTAGTISASASGTGTVTQVVAQGGPFLANGTITTAGTINNSTASLTAHGILVAEGTSAVVATAALTNGQLLIGATGADPAPQTMSGDATINASGTLALVATAVTLGSYGDATHVGAFTVDAKGRLTAASSVAITYPTSLPPSGSAGGDLGGTYPNPTVISVADVTTGRLAFANLATIAAASLFGNSGTIGATGGNIAIGPNLTLATGTLSASASGTGTVTQVISGAGLVPGTITNTGTVALATIAAGSLSGNSAIVAAVPTAIAIGAGLSLSVAGTLAANYQAGTLTTIGTGVTLTSGTLAATGSGGTVTQIVAGSNLTGGTITGSGTIALQASPTITLSGTLPVVINGNTSFPTAPAGTVLHVVQADSVAARVIVDGFGAGSNPSFNGRRAQGTAASPTAVQASGVLLNVAGWGYGATGFSSAGRGSIQIVADENWTDTAQGTRVVINVSANGGTVTAEAMRVANSGIVLVGTTVASGTNKLQVIGGASIDRLVIGSSNSITALGTTIIETSGTLNINLGSVNSWTAAQRSTPVALTSGATVTPDFATGNNFSMTMTVSGTLANPTNIVAGQAGQIVVTQDGTGGRTMALGSVFKTAAGAGITLTTTAAAVDVLSYYVADSTHVELSPGYNFK